VPNPARSDSSSDIFELHDHKPEISLAGWDDIEVQSIVVRDPELLVFAPESTGTDAVLRMPIDPGNYAAAVLIGGLASVSDDVGGVGDDHYRIVLWQAIA
jgi:hypothetical protein